MAFVALGTGLLWFGWFGFNAGSALAANGIAAQAFVNTDIAGSIAMCTWLDHRLVARRQAEPGRRPHRRRGRLGDPITPCAGYVPTWASFIVGVGAGSLCYYAVVFKQRMKWDDALDVWAAHGVGGTLGIILLGVFATYAVNPAGGQGLITGHFHFFGWQVMTAVVVAAYAFVATYLILKLINVFDPIRVPDSVELKGLDAAEFGESAYDLV